MLELSLHILDLIENSLRAGANVVELSVIADQERDLLTVTIEDDGSGLNVPPDVAADPFHTTKGGKRTGLGLSLMRHAAEAAGGSMALRPSALGGLAVEITMKLTHIDRPPLGDLAATVASVVLTNPDVDLRVSLRSGGREATARTSEERGNGKPAWAVAKRMKERVKECVGEMGIQ